MPDENKSWTLGAVDEVVQEIGNMMAAAIGALSIAREREGMVVYENAKSELKLALCGFADAVRASVVEKSLPSVRAEASGAPPVLARDLDDLVTDALRQYVEDGDWLCYHRCQGPNVDGTHDCGTCQSLVERAIESFRALGDMDSVATWTRTLLEWRGLR